MDNKKILICGGHLSPALALIEELRKNKKIELIYIGRKYPLEGDRALSLEYKTISSLDLKFIPFNPGRISRFFTKEAIVSLCKIPAGLVKGYQIINHEKPDMVISFGSYVALPLALAAFFKKVNVITHEQTRMMGLTNRIISKFARYTCLTWPINQSISSNRFIITGGLLRKIDNENDEIVNFGDTNLPLIYITGGSQGSRSINKIVSECLNSLLKHFRLIHQCGMAENSADYREIKIMISKLPKNIQKNYSLSEMLSPDRALKVIRASEFIIGRSGANTVMEIAVSGKPAVFIPLPWSAENEQYENARWLAEKGSALILPQNDLTADKFIAAVNNFQANIRIYQKHALELKTTVPGDGVDKFKKIIFSLFR